MIAFVESLFFQLRGDSAAAGFNQDFDNDIGDDEKVYSGYERSEQLFAEERETTAVEQAGRVTG